MSPTNFCAVTIPENAALPVDLIVTPAPVLETTSNPIECTLLSPVLKFKNVAIAS